MATLDSDYPSDPIDDEYETEPLELPRRRRLPVLTALLALGAVGALMFYAGVEVQKHYGGSSSTSGGSGTAGSFAARFGRGSGGTATTGQSGTGRSATGGFGGLTAGTVTAIKGSTLYVTDASGNVVKVATSPGSSVSKTVPSSVRGINPGDTVVVRGSAGKNGTVTAESITVGGSGTGAAGFGSGASGLGGGGGGATGFGGGG